MIPNNAPNNERNHKPKFNVYDIREDFPILKSIINGKPLVFLDNAASTQKPQIVLDTINEVYRDKYANVHRGVYWLSQETTQAFEGSRIKIQNFINAKSFREIIFVKGTTEAINLVAASYGRQFIKEGDEIIITAIEHHSNIVPWQILCAQTGAKLIVAPVNSKGEIPLDSFKKCLSNKTKFASIVHISNALGTINPIKEMIDLVHNQGAKVLIDGAQAIPHMPVDVNDLDCDFYAFSGHKIYGPSGIGVLYGKENILDAMPPYQSGGDMIQSVSFERTTYTNLPHKFEAGTPHITGVIALGAAIDYIRSINWTEAMKHEDYLLDYATKKIGPIPEVRLIGEAQKKSSIVSFTLKGVHPHDVGTILDKEGIAVRVGHHCAQPVMAFFKIPATVRASFAFYNTKEEVDIFVDGIQKVLEIFKQPSFGV